MLALAALTSPVLGLTTVCSDPERAKILRTARLELPWSKVRSLETWLGTFSEKEMGMSAWSVAFGDKGDADEQIQLILQSPNVSVAITIKVVKRRSIALVTVERTCIVDYLEPWLPYWLRFLDAMRKEGYVISD